MRKCEPKFNKLYSSTDLVQKYFEIITKSSTKLFYLVLFTTYEKLNLCNKFTLHKTYA